MTSSRKTIPSISSSFALAKKMRDVRIVRMPHCWMAEVMASRPAVKLRLTGTFPASNTAIFARAPPIDGGSRSPTIESFRH